ncbi:MAG: helix-turn-helix domain-containing protein [Candidatus Hecatellaceae archaeon]|nr:MAG: transcriptional regulator [Candidatus Hecatellales archaeon]
MLAEKVFRAGFRKTVEEELKQRKMSVRELAKKAGIPLPTLYKALSGERDPRFSTVRRVIKALEPDVKFFIAVIAARFLLDELGVREVEIKGKTYRVKEYPSSTIEECIASAVRAEKDGALGIICAPILASIVEKAVDVPIVIMKPGSDVLKKALEHLARKIEETEAM